MLIAMLIVASLGVGDPDGIVATAPATVVDLSATSRGTTPSVAGAAQAAAPHGLTTDQQISEWLKSRATSDGQSFPEAGLALEDDREMHAEFSVSVGTGGYRDYGAAVSLPLGDKGRLDLSVRQVENGYPHYGRYGYGYSDFGDEYVWPRRSLGMTSVTEARSADGSIGGRSRTRPDQANSQ